MLVMPRKNLRKIVENAVDTLLARGSLTRSEIAELAERSRQQDLGEQIAAVSKAMALNPFAVALGKDAALGVIINEVKKATSGTHNDQELSEAITKITQERSMEIRKEFKTYAKLNNRLTIQNILDSKDYPQGYKLFAESYNKEKGLIHKIMHVAIVDSNEIDLAKKAFDIPLSDFYQKSKDKNYPSKGEERLKEWAKEAEKSLSEREERIQSIKRAIRDLIAEKGANADNLQPDQVPDIITRAALKVSPAAKERGWGAAYSAGVKAFFTEHQAESMKIPALITRYHLKDKTLAEILPAGGAPGLYPDLEKALLACYGAELIFIRFEKNKLSSPIKHDVNNIPLSDFLINHDGQEIKSKGAQQISEAVEKVKAIHAGSSTIDPDAPRLNFDAPREQLGQFKSPQFIVESPPKLTIGRVT